MSFYFDFCLEVKVQYKDKTICCRIDLVKDIVSQLCIQQAAFPATCDFCFPQQELFACLKEIMENTDFFSNYIPPDCNCLQQD